MGDEGSKRQRRSQVRAGEEGHSELESATSPWLPGRDPAKKRSTGSSPRPGKDGVQRIKRELVPVFTGQRIVPTAGIVTSLSSSTKC